MRCIDLKEDTTKILVTCPVCGYHQRVIDFTSGACFTMGGNLQKISKKIIIATPSNVELSGDFTELLGDDDSTDISSYSLKV